MTDKEYDVAISFLSQDQDLALKLYSELSPTLSVFVYSKKQEAIAGTDGTESFREVFRNKSKLSVVLFRKGWGETKFTTVEEAAIKDFGSNHRWKGIVFVMLDGAKPPTWLPEGNIRINYSLYGFEQTVGAIKARAQEEGAVVRKIGPMEQAKALSATQEFARKRETLMSDDNCVVQASELVRILFSEIERHVSVINKEIPSLSLQVVSNRDQCVVRSTGTKSRSSSITWNLRCCNSLRDSNLNVYSFIGLIHIAGEASVWYVNQPRQIGQEQYEVDYTADGWCWKTSDNKYLSSHQLAERLVASQFELMKDAENSG